MHGGISEEFLTALSTILVLCISKQQISSIEIMEKIAAQYLALSNWSAHVILKKQFIV